MFFVECEEVDLAAEIKISKKVISLLGALYMESGMRRTNVCAAWKQSVCAADGSKVTSSSGDVFHWYIWGAPTEHGKARAS